MSRSPWTRSSPAPARLRRTPRPRPGRRAIPLLDGKGVHPLRLRLLPGARPAARGRPADLMGMTRRRGRKRLILAGAAAGSARDDGLQVFSGHDEAGGATAVRLPKERDEIRLQRRALLGVESGEGLVD